MLQYSQDPSGATCINQFVVIRSLGRGSFGKVKLCLNTLDGKTYAIKARTLYVCFCCQMCVFLIDVCLRRAISSRLLVTEE